MIVLDTVTVRDLGPSTTLDNHLASGVLLWPNGQRPSNIAALNPLMTTPFWNEKQTDVFKLYFFQ